MSDTQQCDLVRADTASNDSTAPSTILAEIVRLLGAIEHALSALTERIHCLEERLDEVTGQKDWYSTADLAAVMGVTRHTVQERWCNQARIACEKDPQTGQWRIPAHEFERLKRGGKPASNRSILL